MRNGSSLQTPCSIDVLLQVQNLRGFDQLFLQRLVKDQSKIINALNSRSIWVSSKFTKLDVILVKLFRGHFYIVFILYLYIKKTYILQNFKTVHLKILIKVAQAAASSWNNQPDNIIDKWMPARWLTAPWIRLKMKTRWVWSLVRDNDCATQEAAARLAEIVKYMKTLRAAQHLDLALPSMTEVYPR